MHARAARRVTLGQLAILAHLFFGLRAFSGSYRLVEPGSVLLELWESV